MKYPQDDITHGPEGSWDQALRGIHRDESYGAAGGRKAASGMKDDLVKPESNRTIPGSPDGITGTGSRADRRGCSRQIFSLGRGRDIGWESGGAPRQGDLIGCQAARRVPYSSCVSPEPHPRAASLVHGILVLLARPIRSLVLAFRRGHGCIRSDIGGWNVWHLGFVGLGATHHPTRRAQRDGENRLREG